MCVLFVDIGIFIARHLVIKLDELWIKNATVSIYLSPSVELEFVTPNDDACGGGFLIDLFGKTMSTSCGVDL